MKQIDIDDSWPDSWKSSYFHDSLEIYGSNVSLGYSYAYRNRFDQTIKLVTEVLPAGTRVLDIAAAQGNFSLSLAELGYEVTWNDLRGDLEGYVRLKYEKGSVNFAVGNAFDLKFPHLFDAVLITEVIEHVAHPDEFLRKTAELVKPGGYIIMTTPNGAYFRNKLPRFSDCDDPSIYESVQFQPNSDGHIFLLYPDEVEKFARESGLIIDKFCRFTNPLTNGHVKLGILLKLLPRYLVRMFERLSQKLPVAVADRLLVQIGVRFQKPRPDIDDRRA